MCKDCAGLYTVEEMVTTANCTREQENNGDTQQQLCASCRQIADVQ